MILTAIALTIMSANYPHIFNTGINGWERTTATALTIFVPMSQIGGGKKCSEKSNHLETK